MMPDDILTEPARIIADLRRELARRTAELQTRTAERDEALAQQAATAEVLQVINASPGNLAPVFDAMLDKAMRLCGFHHGSLQTYDGQLFRAVAVRGLPEALAEQLRQGFHPEPTLWMRPLLDGGRFVHIPDLTREDQSHEGVRRAVEFGSRTLLFIPLRTDDVLLGQIVAVRQEVRPFTDKQIALLQNFAAQAVIAMENARLITETREALERQTATSEVLGIISSSPGRLEPVFDAVLTNAIHICDGTFGMLGLIDGDGFHGVAAHGVGTIFTDTVSRMRHPPPGTGLDRMQKEMRTVEVADCLAEPAYEPVRVANPAFAKVRSALHVPMLKGDVLLGAIFIYRDKVLPFDEKQIELVEGFAKQAVIAIENARLITETREALEQQTATAEVLQVINSSPGDLTPVFEAMLDKAIRLCDGGYGSLLSYDGQRFSVMAVAHAEPELAEWHRNRPPFEPTPGGPLHRVVNGEQVVIVEDVQQDEGYRNGIAQFRGVVDVGGYRSLLNAALRKDDRLLGNISIFRKEAGPFSDKQIALLQNFAAQAVIAMENARLLGELRERNEEIAGFNRELEARVATQLAELERTGKLRRFLAPQLAELIVAQGNESILESHRREIVVVFCDLRGFTPFAERAEPEEVMALLKEYHAALGPIVAAFEGTLDHYSGDGIMVFFNDPLPTPEPARRAVEMALAMREAAQGLLRSWRRHGHDLGFGVGISQGYATLGQIGFAERMDYTAIGTVTNLAARLCAEAKDGQILVSARVAAAVEGLATLDEIGDLALKGLSQAVAVFNVVE
jgi:GAF domain-containing protein